SSVKRVRAIEIYRNIRNLKDYIKSLKSIFQMRTRPRQKVEAYVQSYKDGDILFHEPLPEVISAEYEHYKEACQLLGGLSQ
ncbi:hypothetical protein DCO44_10630, partial [Acinetobacter sp. AM]|uniref:hypothetical protein n=1 Tax=Acinetobacter sp. AM TaxID=2170730 RepID=UPI000DE6A478